MEAEQFADEDQQKRESVDTRNEADAMVFQTEKQLKEFGDKSKYNWNAIEVKEIK